MDTQQVLGQNLSADSSDFLNRDICSEVFLAPILNVRNNMVVTPEVLQMQGLIVIFTRRSPHISAQLPDTSSLASGLSVFRTEIYLQQQFRCP